MPYLISHRIDLSTFYDKYKNAHGERSTYDTATLLKIILIQYS